MNRILRIRNNEIDVEMAFWKLLPTIVMLLMILLSTSTAAAANGGAAGAVAD